MAAVRYLAAGLALLFFLTGCGSKPLKEYTFDNGQFKIMLPDEPEKEERKLGGLTLTQLKVKGKQGEYVVTYGERTTIKDEKKEDIQSQLEGLSNVMVRDEGATIIEETKTKLQDKYPGHYVEARLANKKGLLRARIYIVDDRLYQIMVMGDEAWAKSDNASRFLDSFQIVKE